MHSDHNQAKSEEDLRAIRLTQAMIPNFRFSSGTSEPNAQELAVCRAYFKAPKESYCFFWNILIKVQRRRRYSCSPSHRARAREPQRTVARTDAYSAIARTTAAWAVHRFRHYHRSLNLFARLQQGDRCFTAAPQTEEELIAAVLKTVHFPLKNPTPQELSLCRSFLAQPPQSVCFYFNFKGMCSNKTSCRPHVCLYCKSPAHSARKCTSPQNPFSNMHVWLCLRLPALMLCTAEFANAELRCG